MLKENEFHVTKKPAPTSELTKTSPAPPKGSSVERDGNTEKVAKVNSTSGRTKISIAESPSNRDSTSRSRESASRERDTSRRSESREVDRKSKERDRASRERSRDAPDRSKEKKRSEEHHERGSVDRQSRERDGMSESRDSREQMPPPQARRTSAEPTDDRGNVLSSKCF